MKKRRILSMLIVSLLLFSACGSAGKNAKDTESQTNSAPSGSSEAVGIEATSKEEPYTVYFQYMVMSEGNDQAEVEAAINELVLAELNMNVSFVPLTWGVLTQQLQLMLASNEPLDLFVAESYFYSSYIDSGYVKSSADYLDYMQQAVEVIGEEDVYSCMVGDVLIGLPQMRERAYPAGLVVRKDIFDELGYTLDDFSVTTSDFSTFEQLDALFEDVRAHYPNMVMLDGTIIMGNLYDTYIDKLGDGFGVLENYGQTTTVTNWVESEQFYGLASVARRWFQKGYESQDIAVNQDGGETKMRSGNTFSFVSKVKPDTNVEKKSQTGYDVEVIPISDVVKPSNGANATVYAIANASEDPAKAAQFLNWTYISTEFEDLINWGIEGKHWEKTEAGLAAYPAGVDTDNVGYHNGFGFIYPNQFAGTPWDGSPADVWEQYKIYNQSAMTSMAYGFMFDSTVVSDEIAQLHAVEDEYHNDIAFGTVDIDAALPQYVDKLYQAGLQNVINEKQRQLDAFLASKK